MSKQYLKYFILCTTGVWYLMAHSLKHKTQSCDYGSSFLNLALSSVNVMHKRPKLHCSQIALHCNIVVQFCGVEIPLPAPSQSVFWIWLIHCAGLLALVFIFVVFTLLCKHKHSRCSWPLHWACRRVLIT